MAYLLWQHNKGHWKLLMLFFRKVAWHAEVWVFQTLIASKSWRLYTVALEEMEAVTQVAKLNGEQRTLVLQDLDEIRERHPPLRSRAYFLDGPRGSGKTMCYNTLISYCQ